MPHILLDHVTVVRDDRRILQDIHMELSEYRIGIIGANGSGKSTLLRVIMGLEQPTSGTIRFAMGHEDLCVHARPHSRSDLPESRKEESEDVSPLPHPTPERHGERRVDTRGSSLRNFFPRSLIQRGSFMRRRPTDTHKAKSSRVRRVIGFLFAEPDSQLLMPTVAEDINLSMLATRTGHHAPECDSCTRSAHKSQPGADSRTPQEFLKQLGWHLPLDQAVSTLSSGEKQLAALASVFAGEPRLVLCDEPATRLDRSWHTRIVGELMAAPQQLVIATHDLELAARMDRVIVMHMGQVVYDGSPNTAIEHYIARIDAESVSGRLAP